MNVLKRHECVKKGMNVLKRHECVKNGMNVLKRHECVKKIPIVIQNGVGKSLSSGRVPSCIANWGVETDALWVDESEGMLRCNSEVALFSR